MPLPPIVLAPGGGELLDYGHGDVSVVLAAGEATEDAFSVVEHRLASRRDRPDRGRARHDRARVAAVPRRGGRGARGSAA